MDSTNIVKLAIDAIEDKVRLPENYSKGDTSEVLRQAFVDLNGGSTKLTRKSLRNPELFEIIEQILPVITRDGLTGDEFFMNFVDYRNKALGDDIHFWTEDNSLFLVSEIANGTQAVRRQRLNAGVKTTIPTSIKAIKVFEELDRLLSGRVDFNKFVDRVGKSMANKVYTDIYNCLNGITVSTSGMSADYYKTGSFAEDVLLTLVDHVEASMGVEAKIIGTRAALRNVTTAVVSDSGKEDFYNIGYYGKFNGVPMFATKQKHTAGTDTFVFDDTKIYVIGGDDKFIKVVDEGDGLLKVGDPLDNADLTQEYLYAQKYGVGAIITGRVGIYDLT